MILLSIMDGLYHQPFKQLDVIQELVLAELSKLNDLFMNKK